MHERSLLLALLTQVDRIQAEHDHAPVEEITVDAGRLSGVEPTLLCSAFEEFTPRHPHARLIVKESPVTAMCHNCSQTWAMDRFVSQCPHCRSLRVQITGGDAFLLLHVTLKDG